MTFYQYQTANNAIGTLKTAITSIATQYILNTGEGDLFPDPTTDNYFVCMEQWDTQGRVTKRELRKVTAKTGDTFTATRAADLVPISYATLTQAATALSFDPADGEVTIRITTPAAYFANIIAEMVRLESAKLDKTTYNAERQIFAASSAGDDDYEITSADITAYTNGQTFKIQADVANTGPATLKLNALAAKALKKLS